MAEPSPTPRTRVRRLPQRAAYDEATIHAILDNGLVCHIGFVHEGQPFVLPTTYARLGDASADVEGDEPDWEAAAAACPVGVPLSEVAAVVRRLAAG